MSTRETVVENLVYQAKLAEQAERYEEMVDFMKEVASKMEELGLEERNLLSVAYKNVVGARRASLRIISSIQTKEEGKAQQESNHLKLILAYRGTVVEELENICYDILSLLIRPEEIADVRGEPFDGNQNDSDGPNLIYNATDDEAKVFYQKMAADYFRYLAEFNDNSSKQNVSAHAEKMYKAAFDVAEKGLAPTHPIRLGLALNFSVFQFEVQSMQEEACCLAKAAFDDAIAELDTLDEESYKDSTLIMQLLRDNLTLWTSDDSEQP